MKKITLWEWLKIIPVLKIQKKDQTVQKEFLPEEITHDRENSAHQQEIPAGTDAPTAPFEKSGLRLVTDLQHCLKAQQSKAYAGKVKLSNLQPWQKHFPMYRNMDITL